MSHDAIIVGGALKEVRFIAFIKRSFRPLITRWNFIMNGVFADPRSFVRRFGILSQLRALARQIFSQGFSRGSRNSEGPARGTEKGR